MAWWQFWKMSEYGKDARQVTGDMVKRVFAREFIFDVENINDLNYLLLDEQKMRDFIFKYWDVSTMKYHGASDEFPDCDDFAAIMFSGALRGAIKEQFKYPPLFGTISLNRQGRGYHRQNWAIVAPSKLMLFEPQTGKWADDLSDVEFVGVVEI